MTPTPPFLLPANEVERLRTLRQLDIQRSLGETVFDGFARLAARIFNLPISLISLVEEDQVEYIANEGLPSLRSQPRIEAICSLAVREGKAVVFTNVAQQEARLSAAAAIAARQKELRFYAGVPLRLPDLRCIGTLCIIDQQARAFSTEEQEVLEHLSTLIVRTIAVRHYCLTGDGLGAAHWATVQAKLLEELQQLTALVRYLFTRFGHSVPVTTAILEQVLRRFQDVHVILVEYQRPAY